MDEILELRAELEKYEHAYHVLDNPLISDYEYDQLAQRLKFLEQMCPEAVSREEDHPVCKPKHTAKNEVELLATATTMSFVAIDFETANTKHAPCAIGLVIVENNTIIDEYYSLINPEQPFSRVNVNVHGITSNDVADAPTFAEVWEKIGRYFRRYPIVAHNVEFDMSVLEKAVRRYRLNALPVAYYDTMRLYQHNYPSANAFDLKSICDAFDIEVERHHNALSDAKAAAQIMINLLSSKDNDIFPFTVAASFNCEFCNYADSKEDNVTTDSYFTGEPEFAATTAIMSDVEEVIFVGSSFVITGFIAGYDRSELERLIQKRGGKVASNVSKKTDYVVTGLQDVSVVSDSANAKSSKILKAEALRAEGHSVKIIGANTFLESLQKDQ